MWKCRVERLSESSGMGNCSSVAQAGHACSCQHTHTQIYDLLVYFLMLIASSMLMNLFH